MVRHPNLLLGGMRGTGVSGHRRLQALQAFQKKRPPELDLIISGHYDDGALSGDAK
jgi:hypothetical protein